MRRGHAECARSTKTLLSPLMAFRPAEFISEAGGGGWSLARQKISTDVRDARHYCREREITAPLLILANSHPRTYRLHASARA